MHIGIGVLELTVVYGSTTSTVYAPICFDELAVGERYACYLRHHGGAVERAAATSDESFQVC